MERDRRVVITGMGAVSSIGANLAEIESSLREGASGIRLVPEWQDLGLFSNICGSPENPEPTPEIASRRELKSSSSNALMALEATGQALQQAGLETSELRGSDTAVIIGSGTGSTLQNWKSCKTLMAHKTTKRVNPFTVQQVMGSTASANVSVALGTRGESWSVSSACSTGAHAIGLATRLIRAGIHDSVIAGASDEIDWTRAAAFDAMHALSRRYNDTPERASRPFDSGRDGFVIGSGAGVVMLESLQRAESRGAPIVAEVLGFGTTSDGHEMVAPLKDGAVTTMRAALADAGLGPEKIEYVNAHGTSTHQGDASEAAAMAEIFGERQPFISSTKSTTGHAIGAAGSLEAIYTLLMLRGGFLAPNINLEKVDPACAHLRIVTERSNSVACRIGISNSFGFGGTNACLVLGVS
ncbi:MAG: beta-ketoacyl-[acyl-carrier-protein] synthase family protein [Myxococcales bacterium]|nr:beta-ketoacyl-[acyl-carrier-protein] synthase family protein [Myxococcales bacterium]